MCDPEGYGPPKSENNCVSHIETSVPPDVYTGVGCGVEVELAVVVMMILLRIGVGWSVVRCVL